MLDKIIDVSSYGTVSENWLSSLSLTHLQVIINTYNVTPAVNRIEQKLYKLSTYMK